MQHFKSSEDCGSNTEAMLAANYNSQQRQMMTMMAPSTSHSQKQQMQSIEEEKFFPAK